MQRNLIIGIVVIAILLVAGALYAQGGINIPSYSTTSTTTSTTASATTAATSAPGSATATTSATLASATTLTSATTATTAATSTGAVRQVTAVLDHSAGYIFSGNSVVGTTITVNKGDTLKISATSNQPAHQHGITIDAYSINQAVTESNTIIQFVANQAGSFKIYCKTCETGPQGPHAWMAGTLVVNG